MVDFYLSHMCSENRFYVTLILWNVLRLPLGSNIRSISVTLPCVIGKKKMYKFGYLYSRLLNTSLWKCRKYTNVGDHVKWIKKRTLNTGYMCSSVNYFRHKNKVRRRISKSENKNWKKVAREILHFTLSKWYLMLFCCFFIIYKTVKKKIIPGETGSIN